jgi:hypothetical protein
VIHGYRRIVSRRIPSILSLVALGIVLATSACEEGPTVPPLGVESDVPAAVAWNDVLLEAVAAHPWTPPHAARTFAYLGVAQHEALLELDNGPGETSKVAARAAVSAASAAVLRELYPMEEARIARAVDRLGPRGGAFASRAQVDIGRSAGLRAAARVIARARADGGDAVWTGEVPAGPGIWFSSTGEPPLAPMAGGMLPWTMAHVEDFDPPPPPAFGSAEFQAALAEARAFSDQRTPEMTRIARFYEYGPGTSSPAGQYVALAAQLIVRDGLGERDAARTFAILGTAMADAGIACWRAKYQYWLLRPSQADPAITFPIGLPNFPAYPSGHSSFSGAAEGVLSALFPADAAELHRFAEENGLSRIYGGVHFSFDNTAGLELGRRIAPLALSAGGRLAPVVLAAR